ncbi:MAG: TenA family protein [Elainellaceae cyanobacterium]
MNLARELWQAEQDLAIASLNHPFVQGIGDGSLPKSKFAYYVGQDAFFLEAFARAYSIAAAKAPDWQGFGIFHSLAEGVLEELKLHHSYAAEWNVDLSQVEAGAATRRYTDFLLATAWSHEVGITTCAMLPCMKLYAFLGQSLAETTPSPHTYTDWIQTYSSDDFNGLAVQLGQLAEQYAQINDASHSVYRYAMQCELDFFEAAWCETAP